ncbi:type II secretion system ATPase GspE [soil metagenome]
MAVESALRPVPYAFARDAKLVLTIHDRDDGAEADVMICDKTDPDALAELARRYGKLNTRWASEAEVETHLRSAYAQADGAAARIVEAEADIDIDRLMQEIPAVEDLLEVEDDAPIIRMINALLTQAARDGASDIHIEAFEQYSVVRFRVDGTLRDIAKPRRQLHAALISRIKIMAQLDIAEKRMPQDGRITLRVAGRPVDVRVSTLPTGHGERAVLRLLEKDAGRLDLAKLGMAEGTLKTFDRLVRQPHGIILVTGPTGSGKTTTLYAAMQRLEAATNNIMTVEDPIEYDLPGIGQTQVNARIDMTFAKALRAILRQDPDVIMIGEIRDLETAQIAVQASLTGHLVLATLHTNDSASAITRLTDMGVEPFLLSSSVLGVLAQRLIRRLCNHCKLAATDETGRKVWRAVGCDKCSTTGYTGRSGIYELLEVDDEMRHLIHNGANELDVRRSAANRGMISMRGDGQRWIDSGVTSPEEVVRVTRD